MEVVRFPKIEVVCGDCLKSPAFRSRKYNCVFMDPPDNIGLEYDGVGDRQSVCDYLAMIGEALRLAWFAAPVTWLSFNARWTMKFAKIIGAVYHDHEIKPCVQTFTFGQHRETDFGNNHRPLWRLGNGPFYADQIRVESWRQANGDKRANPAGRVPGDVFDFPRVTGNSKQRRAWHPTQLHEGLVERCILSCTLPGDWVLDPFAGTGTTGRVCRRLGRNCVLIEKSEAYCEKIERDLFYDTIGIADSAH